MTAARGTVPQKVAVPHDDPVAFRSALGRFATGVTVITTTASARPLGITANSFASVSLDPPLVLWSPAKASRRFAPFTEATRFAIHVMGVEQEPVCAAFVREGNPFAELDWTTAADGTPLIEGCLARFHCALHEVHDAGDHAIVVGRVLAATHRDGLPLIFSAGRYGQFTSPE